MHVSCNICGCWILVPDDSDATTTLNEHITAQHPANVQQPTFILGQLSAPQIPAPPSATEGTA